MSRRARIVKKKDRNINKTVVIAIIIMVCLSIIYRFNFKSKSEKLNKTTVSFKEYNSENVLSDDLDILEDEQGKYILLPEKVSGYYVEEYYVKQKVVLPEIQVNTNTDDVDNSVAENNNDLIENNVTNSSANTILDNTNTTENSNTQNIETNAISTETNTINSESKNTVANNTTNTVADNSAIETNTNTNTNTNTIENTIVDNDNTNTVVDEKTENSVETLNENKDEVVESLFDKAVQKQEETQEEKQEENNETEEIEENVNKENIEENTQSENADENQKLDNTGERLVEEQTLEESENIEVEEFETVTYTSGDKIYISDEEIKDKSLEIEVKYNTTEVKDVTLYKQELEAIDEYSTIKVDGYIPFGYGLETEKKENEEVEKLKEDVEGLEHSSIILAYDIKIKKEAEEYQPKDYYQNVNVTITSAGEFENSLIGNSVEMLHIIENTDDNEMIFERISLSNKTEDSVECLANEFSTYAVAVADTYTADQVIAYNYDNDYNYYIGKNFTDNISGENSGSYTDNNLAEVTVNYYSYDYSKNLNAPDDVLISNAGWSVTSNGNSNGNGPDIYYQRDYDENFNQIYTYYDRIYHVTITITAPNGKIIDSSRPWSMSFNTSDRIMLETLQGLNNNMFSSTPTYTGGKLNLSGNNLDSWTRDNLSTYHITLNLRYNLGRNVGTPATINMNTLSGFSFSSKEKILVGYIGPTGERQTLFTYVLCLPMDSSGNVNFELIDNPFMDRPTDGNYAGWGFDGWKSNESYSISTDTNTFVQTLSAGTTDKKATINLYPNWSLANIIFVDGTNNGNDADDGTFDNPVRTWGNNNNNNAGVKKCLMSSNFKTASYASNRELNIIVIKAGTLTGINTQNDREYTITSLFNGVDYRASNAALNINGSVTLNKDIQLDFVDVTGPGYYGEAITTAAEGGWYSGYSRGNNQYKNGLTNLGTYIIGNCYNLRIGRGMFPRAANETNDRTTFTQVQGGYGGNQDIYKLVVESGKYVNIQVGAAYNSTNYSANAIAVFGSDYDRIKDQANQGAASFIVASKIASRTYTDIISTRDSSKPLFDMRIKSGNIGLPVYGLNDEEYTPYAGVYLGGHGYSNNSGTTEDLGDRILTIEGGKIANIVGGLKTLAGTDVKTNIYVKGGNIINIVGGAGRSTCYGDRIIQITDGTIQYSVSGGSNGYTSENTGTNNGLLEGNTLVYVGGNAVIGTTDSGTRNQLYYVEDGCVLGAGNGNANAGEAGKVDSSHIIIDGNANVKNNVYGGGNFGVVGPKTSSTTFDFDVVSFENKSATDVSSGQYIISTGLGSGSQVITANGTYLTTSQISTRAFPTNAQIFDFERTGNQYYIGNNGAYFYQTQGRISTTNMRAFDLIQSGQGVKIRLYYQYQYRYLRYNNGTISYTTNANNSGTTFYLLQAEELPMPPGYESPAEVTVEILGGRVGNDVYGGANQNNINGSVKVKMENGTVEGTMYGGSNTKGTVTSSTSLNITGGTIGTTGTNTDRVFGGGKGNQTIISGNTTVNITDSANNVKIYGDTYGGSALGRVSGNSTVKIEDKSSAANTITLSGNVYGGGKGQTGTAAINGGDTTVIVDGGTYSTTKVFGGSNINGTIDGDILVKVGETTTTTVNEVYGGGNQANVTNITDSVYVHMYENATVTNAFNGGNSAGIAGNTTQTPRAIYSEGATITNLYGGSNSSGTLTDTYVYVSDNSTVGSVFGGGFGPSTSISNDTHVDIQDSSITSNVFGGGDSGPVTNNTNVNIENTTVGNTVFGGGNKAQVGKNTTVLMNSSTAGTVYGGGNEGSVGGNTDVDILNSSNVTTIYGGGCAAAVAKNTDVYIENSTANKVYGGGQGTTATVGENTSVDLENSTITNVVFGGGDAGKVTGNTTVLANNTSITNKVYGGGNQADVDGSTNVTMQNNSTTKLVYGGGEKGAVGTDTNVNILEVTITNSVFGGGNEGDVTGSTTVLIDGAHVANNVFGGGQSADVGSTTVTFQAGSTADYVYGGGDQGEVDENTKVTIDSSTINQNVYGGGNGAASSTGTSSPGQVDGNTELIIKAGSVVTGSAFGGGRGTTANVGEDTSVDLLNSTVGVEIYGGGDNGPTEGNTDVEINNSTVTGSAYAGGKGITATVGGNTNMEATTATIGEDIYGGGNNGMVNGNTEVRLTNSTITGSAYAAGNGADAITKGNTHIIAEGTTSIGASLFGGGNAAATGIEWTNYSGERPTVTAIVDIAGAQIGENAYGGANSSVVYGNTVVNVGTKAIDDYYETAKNYTKGKIDIKGTIYGGGEQMDPDPNVEYNYNTVSVEGSILINVDGTGYDTGGNTINIEGSIFGSGHASRACIPIIDNGNKIYPLENTINGNVFIRNYGNIDNPKKMLSIQRCGDVMLDSSALWISGAIDSINYMKSSYFTFNRIGALKLKNGSTLYLRNGANMLESFYSLVGEDGSEELAEVEIDRENGVLISKNVDNRIYMYSGNNLNISPDEKLATYGPVYGMTFFGIYKNSSNEATTGDDEPGNELAGIFTGIYDQDYTVGGSINFADRNYVHCYVVGQHKSNHDIEKDGFYTNFELLPENLQYEPNITESNYSGTSYTDYITPTPDDDIYYMWYAGPDAEVYPYNLILTASKFSTFGTEELPLLGLSKPNAVMTISSVDAELINGIEIVDKNTIPNINYDQDEANSKFGLTMKTSTVGWSMTGSTDYFGDYTGYADYDHDGYGTPEKPYKSENSTITPTLSFYLYHSNNITLKRDLGYYTIVCDYVYWKDAINRKTAKIVITLLLKTDLRQEVGYNGTITPGTQYELFTNAETNITTNSSFSTFFELAEPNFSQLDVIRNYYSQAYRVIYSDYVFPEDTTITMIDRHDNNNPSYYYYTVTATDVANSKREFKFSEFLAMGSTDEPFDEATKKDEFYIESLDYEYESFIFIVNFESAKFRGLTEEQLLVTKDQLISIYMKAIVNDREEMLFSLLGTQAASIKFGIYNTSSKIKIDADISKPKIYLGNKDVTLDINTNYEVTIIDSVRVHDTQYFDKKLGVKITLLNKDTDEVINGSSLLGTFFSLDGENYYPRTDGTTRIKVADKVSNAASSITFNTDYSTLESGSYYFLIESFGSADGIYFGVNASDSDTVDVQILSDIYGLDSHIPDQQVIIDKETGHTLDEKGYISNEDNELDVSVDYLSGLPHPYISIKLYRRDYEDAYDLTYTQVNLADYITDNLSLMHGNEYPLEYEAVSESEIAEATEGLEDTDMVTFDLNYTLDENLMSGTYRIVFTLYDRDDYQVPEYVENVNTGELEPTGVMLDKTDFEYIGETYSYIIIK